MGQISFNPSAAQNNTNSGTFNGPRFFALKKDKDSAIVRFMYNSPSEFEIFETHKAVTPKFKFGRTVSCNRDVRDETPKCPLCAAGYKVQQKFYVRLIEYVRNADGTVTPEARIWERPMGFAYELSNKANLYGALNNNLFIITRNTPNPNNVQDTTYTIDFAPSQVYPDTMYPYKPELFDNYKISGTALYAPTVEDMNYYLANGDFPAKQPTDTTVASVQQSAAQTPPWETPPAPVRDPFEQITAEMPFGVDPTPSMTQPPTQSSAAQDPMAQRPIRYY